MIRSISSWPRATWIWLAAGLLTVLVYWPSLHGGYIFDDGVYFVDNTDVHVTTLRLGDWAKAALQQAGTTQFRALSMLSFAINYYFTGLDPFWPKATNLGIHLLNGLLLFALLKEVFGFWRIAAPGREDDASRLDVNAALVAGTWLLLPINLTGVAYVAQRMESLANLFVFLGLFVYLRMRRREFVENRNGYGPALAIMACMALGFSAKEPAVMLPLYTACAEWSITRFRNSGGEISRSAVAAHGIFLALPMLAGLAWISMWVFGGISTFRTFSIGQRLLTEPRVLVHYIDWTLLPNINDLTFYHDDFRASRSLFDPPSTAASIAFLFALLAVALWQRKRKPLFCLGILWFLAGHLLTGTVIPLELVFEHRNYFPSAGLLLAMTSLLALEPGLRLPFARAAIAGAFIAWCSFTTFLRSEEWSNPIRLAYAEALKRPDASRAQYELARTLILAAGNDPDSPLIQRSVAILERNAYRTDSGIAPLQALIFINGRAHRPIDPRWWQAIVQKFHGGAPSQTDLSSVIFLFRCQQRGECPDQPREMLDAFTAAIASSGNDPNVLSAYADFAIDRLHDPGLAVRASQAVVASKPGVPVYHANLVKMLILDGRFDEARAEIARLRHLDVSGSQESTIADLERLIARAGRSPPAPGTNPSLPVGPASR